MCWYKFKLSRRKSKKHLNKNDVKTTTSTDVMSDVISCTGSEDRIGFHTVSEYCCDPGCSLIHRVYPQPPEENSVKIN